VVYIIDWGNKIIFRDEYLFQVVPAGAQG